MKTLSAYERGVDDGFFRGTESGCAEDWSESEKAAYKRGYDHGVWMYCETHESV